MYDLHGASFMRISNRVRPRTPLYSLRRNKMGRPIQKKYFGNKNLPDYANVSNKSGIGGESVATITVSNSGTLYSQGATVAIGGGTIITGGSAATISNSINSAGNVTVTKTGSGLGYTAAPSITVTPAATVNPTADATSGTYTLTNVSSVAGVYVGMRIDGAPGVQTSTYVTSVGTNTVTLTKTMTASTTTNSYQFSDVGASFASSVALAATITTQNAIAFTSFLLTKDGGASAVANGDIVKQESSRRYLVDNSQGIGQCKLVATDALTAGTMKIIATDGAGSTYFVTKLTAHKATLVNRTSTSTAKSITGAAVGWTLGSATGTVVTIANA